MAVLTHGVPRPRACKGSRRVHLAIRGCGTSGWLTTASATTCFSCTRLRSLPSPDDRHFSRQGRSRHLLLTLGAWERVADALGPERPRPRSTTGDVDWVGRQGRQTTSGTCSIPAPARAEHGLVQRIGLATSADLFCSGARRPVLVADERGTRHSDPAVWPDQAWRDPWVFREPAVVAGTCCSRPGANQRSSGRPGRYRPRHVRLICIRWRQLALVSTGPRFRAAGSTPGGNHRGPVRPAFLLSGQGDGQN